MWSDLTNAICQDIDVRMMPFLELFSFKPEKVKAEWEAQMLCKGEGKKKPFYADSSDINNK